jgi:hypothetical protein
MREGVLSGLVAAAAIEKARQERGAILASVDTKASTEVDRVIRMLPRAAEAYRQTIKDMATVLGDPRRIHKARADLREILGDTIPLRPEGDYLVAELTFRPRILLRAAGSELWNGSGGEIWSVPTVSQSVRVK